jgi:hypothetical protein
MYTASCKQAKPSQILHTWKAYATRRLRSTEAPNRILWSRGGNASRISSNDYLRRAITYVLHGQGDPMETYVGSDS